MSDQGKIIYGFKQSDAISVASLLSCVHHDDVDSLRRAFDSAGFPENIEIEHRLLKGSEEVRWVITRGRHVFDEKGALLEVIGVTFDVTAQKEAAAQLQASREEVAHLSRIAMMAEIATSLAHELTQPLTAIMSNAEAGQRMLEERKLNLHEFGQLLLDIRNDVSRAGEVVHGIRRMVKKTLTQRVSIDLNSLVQTTLPILRPEALLNSCELKAKLEPNLPAVEADPVGIQQVLVNLIINSIEATRHKPSGQRKVVITTQRKSETEIELGVRDSGPGIPEEARGKVFEQFFTTKSEGLGMGLAISRSIVEAHKGSIGAENMQSGGARFYFTLPVLRTLVKAERLFPFRAI
jgi:C4-dicarboxylate-specific signal transduction histidine kinase